MLEKGLTFIPTLEVLLIFIVLIICTHSTISLFEQFVNMKKKPLRHNKGSSGSQENDTDLDQQDHTPIKLRRGRSTSTKKRKTKNSKKK